MAAASPRSGLMCNPKARETARRRQAYERIDAAYFAGHISESARELAKWQVRVLCGVGSYFDTTQSEQARRFLCPRHRRYLSRRQILRLNDELDAADLIWREARGTSYRTYITAYVARPVPHAEELRAQREPAQEVREPTYDEVRQAVDQAVSAGEVERAAMLAYQLAMLLARQANTHLPVSAEQRAASGELLYFGASNGDIDDTPSVTGVSPTTLIKDSDIPNRDVESPVCTQRVPDGGDSTYTSYGNQDAHRGEVSGTEAVTRLRAWGVQSPAKLRQFSAVPLDQIDYAFRSAHAAGGGVGLGLAMLEHGVWERGRTLVPPPGVIIASEQHQRRYELPCSACGARSVLLTIPGSRCEHCGALPDDELGKDDGLLPDPVLWQEIIRRIAPDQASLETWLAPAMIAHDDEQRLIIACPNSFVRQQIEEHYLEQVRVAAAAVLGRCMEVDAIVKHLKGVTLPVAMRGTNELVPGSAEASLTRADRLENNVRDQEPLHIDDPDIQKTRVSDVGVATYDELWRMVTTQITVPPNEWMAWIAPTHLLHVDEEYAIIGTPNTFVRDAINGAYRQQLEAALSALTGRPLQLQVVIGSSTTRSR